MTMKKISASKQLPRSKIYISFTWLEAGNCCHLGSPRGKWPSLPRAMAISTGGNGVCKWWKWGLLAVEMGCWCRRGLAAPTYKGSKERRI